MQATAITAMLPISRPVVAAVGRQAALRHPGAGAVVALPAWAPESRASAVHAAAAVAA